MWNDENDSYLEETNQSLIELHRSTKIFVIQCSLFCVTNIQGLKFQEWNSQMGLFSLRSTKAIEKGTTVKIQLEKGHQQQFTFDNFASLCRIQVIYSDWL